MKQLTLLLAFLISFNSAYAQLDTTDLKTQITSNFPDNTAGFITPARLRAVALDLMRSNANLLERNEFSEPLQVNDSIKTTDGFYRWTGSEWASISNDTTAWARSGGFILPLDYSDKLSIDTARIEGLLYPNGAVNIGSNSDPFDTLFVNEMIGGSRNTLNQAYNEGGAGLGRIITADAGAVEISATYEAINVRGYKSQFQVDTNLFDIPSLFGAGANISGIGMRRYIAEDSTSWVFVKVTDDSKVGGDTIAALGYFNATTLQESYVENNNEETFSFTGDDAVGIGWYQSFLDSAWYVYSSGSGDLDSKEKILEVTHDDSVNIYVENGGLKIVDGNQGAYKYLTSDANGNASWGPDGCFTGWESITDNTNSWVITAGDTVTIAIHRDITINSQLPCGIDSLWNEADSTIIGRNGDALNISLDFTATQNTASATEFKFWFNIGGAVGAIYPTTFDQNKGNGVDKQYNKTTTVYTLDTWETNGAKIQFTADQNLTISDVTINLFRIHKAR